MAKTPGKTPTPQSKGGSKTGKRPEAQTSRERRAQERHIYKENMAELKGKKKQEQIRQEGMTARTATRSAAITSAISQGFRSAQDVSGKQIELQQLISGNRYSENDANDERKPSPGDTTGGGNSITQNPNAGGTVLK